MAKRKAHRFKVAGDTGVSMFITGRPDPLRLEASGTYTTDDPQEIEALQGSPHAVEVKIPERS